MKYVIVAFILFSKFSYSKQETICGPTDNRVPSDNSKIARSSLVGGVYGCSVTMIGRSCAISAGHCAQLLEQFNFNVSTNIDGGPQKASPENIYLKRKDSLKFRDDGHGNDWAVMRMDKNVITDLYPGDVQGWYSVKLIGNIKKGQRIRITGYGVDEYDTSKSFSQQTHVGKIVKSGGWLNKSTLFHNIDTTGGNSGSSIILEATNEVIGIHSHGGCSSNGGTNKGTIISKNGAFIKAIRSCLDSENELL